MNDSTTVRAIDRAALLRLQQRHALAPTPPWLHGEVARRMAERLAVFKRVPTVVIDWWSRSGASNELLRSAYPKARVVKVEPAEAIARPPVAWWQSVIRRAALSIDAAAVQPQAAQLVWANMVLHQHFDPDL